VDALEKTAKWTVFVAADDVGPRFPHHLVHRANQQRFVSCPYLEQHASLVELGDKI